MSEEERLFHAAVARLREVAAERDRAEALLERVKSLVKEAHDELVALGSHRVLLVGAMSILLRDMGADAPEEKRGGRDG